MIVEKLINFFFSCLEGVLAVLPAVDFKISDGVLNGIFTVFHGIGFFLPLGMITPIFIFELSFLGFRIGRAIIKAIFGH